VPWKRPGVTTVTKPLLLAAAALAAFVLVYPTVRERLPSLHVLGNPTTRAGVSQSAAQISPGEFEQIEAGTSPAGIRATVGEPASKSETTVEGLRLECWYYGVAGSTGAYQLCFKNGRLATKLRFGRG
jgi:hypothetical protein